MIKVCVMYEERNKTMSRKKELMIPKATAKRLPIYYRYVRTLEEEGVQKFSSADLSAAVHVDSATIRRDFSYFGELGKRGYGYDVHHILYFFSEILNEDRLMNVAVVGIGNLGSAILNFKFQNTKNIRISCAFDIREDLVGRIIDGVPVYDMKDLKQQIHRQNIEIAVLTIPEKQAQEAADALVDAGVKGILNFTPQHLSVPKGVQVQNIDLTTELQTLIYFVKANEANE